MVEVGTRIVCVDIFEHRVSGFPGGGIRVRTYPPMDRVPSVGGLGLVMSKYGGGGGETKCRQ